MKKRIVILGAGLSGLAAGEILSKYAKVKMFEKENYLGGLAATFECDGKEIPNYYHHIIKSNSRTKEYLEKFGEINKLDWKKIKVAIGVDKKLSTINTSLGLLKFDYLNLYEKFRFGLFGLYSLFLMNPDKISQGLDAQTWLKKYAGKSVTDKIFFNLYGRNKFDMPLDKISAKQFANRLHEKEVQNFFAYPSEGYQGMLKGLEKSIKKNLGEIKISSKITEVNLKGKYVIESGEKIKYDILISTIPFPVFVKLAKGLQREFKEQISRIRYCPAVCVVFATEDFLDKNHYWINLFNERVHVIIQHSILCDNYDGKINWCLRYGGSEEDLNLNNEEIKKKYLEDVKKYFPNIEVKWARVIKTKYGEPVYDIDYNEYVPDYKSPFDGLYFAGIQLTYPKIRNMNVALDSGVNVAKQVINDLDYS